MKMLPVRIRWRDSNRYLYQVETTEPLCVETIETCGFLVRKEKRNVVIAQDLISGDWRGVIVIPRENIESLELLSKKI